MSIFTMIFTALFSENIVLTKFLGIDTFSNRDEEEKNTLSMSIMLVFIVLLSTFFTYLLNKYILIPMNAKELETIMFLLIIICIVQLTDIIIKKYFKKFHKFLKITLPLMVANTAIFGIILSTISMEYTLINSLIYSLSSSLGFIFIMYVMVNINKKIRNNDIIKSFKGFPISLITLGLIALIMGRLI